MIQKSVNLKTTKSMLKRITTERFVLEIAKNEIIQKIKSNDQTIQGVLLRNPSSEASDFKSINEQIQNSNNIRNEEIPRISVQPYDHIYSPQLDLLESQKVQEIVSDLITKKFPSEKIVSDIVQPESTKAISEQIQSVQVNRFENEAASSQKAVANEKHSQNRSIEEEVLNIVGDSPQDSKKKEADLKLTRVIRKKIPKKDETPIDKSSKQAIFSKFLYILQSKLTEVDSNVDIVLSRNEFEKDVESEQPSSDTPQVSNTKKVSLEKVILETLELAQCELTPYKKKEIILKRQNKNIDTQQSINTCDSEIDWISKKPKVQQCQNISDAFDPHAHNVGPTMCKSQLDNLRTHTIYPYIHSSTKLTHASPAICVPHSVIEKSDIENTPVIFQPEDISQSNIPPNTTGNIISVKKSRLFNSSVESITAHNNDLPVAETATSSADYNIPNNISNLLTNNFMQPFGEVIGSSSQNNKEHFQLQNALANSEISSSCNLEDNLNTMQKNLNNPEKYSADSYEYYNNLAIVPLAKIICNNFDEQQNMKTSDNPENMEEELLRNKHSERLKLCKIEEETENYFQNVINQPPLIVSPESELNFGNQQGGNKVDRSLSPQNRVSRKRSHSPANRRYDSRSSYKSSDRSRSSSTSSSDSNPLPRAYRRGNDPSISKTEKISSFRRLAEFIEGQLVSRDVMKPRFRTAVAAFFKNKQCLASYTTRKESIFKLLKAIYPESKPTDIKNESLKDFVRIAEICEDEIFCKAWKISYYENLIEAKCRQIRDIRRSRKILCTIKSDHWDKEYRKMETKKTRKMTEDKRTKHAKTYDSNVFPKESFTFKALQKNKMGNGVSKSNIPSDPQLFTSIDCIGSYKEFAVNVDTNTVSNKHQDIFPNRVSQNDLSLVRINVNKEFSKLTGNSIQKIKTADISLQKCQTSEISTLELDREQTNVGDIIHAHGKINSHAKFSLEDDPYDPEEPIQSLFRNYLSKPIKIISLVDFLSDPKKEIDCTFEDDLYKPEKVIESTDQCNPEEMTSTDKVFGNPSSPNIQMKYLSEPEEIEPTSEVFENPLSPSVEIKPSYEPEEIVPTDNVFGNPLSPSVEIKPSYEPEEIVPTDNVFGNPLSPSVEIKQEPEIQDPMDEDLITWSQIKKEIKQEPESTGELYYIDFHNKY